jgi:hypothetical protein
MGLWGGQRASKEKAVLGRNGLAATAGWDTIDMNYTALYRHSSKSGSITIHAPPYFPESRLSRQNAQLPKTI